MSNIDQIIKNAPKKTKRRTFDFQIERIYGEEPVWDGIENTQSNFQTLVTKALNWCNASLEHSEYKEEVLKYAQTKGTPTNKLEQLADWKFVNAGKLAWLVNNACPLTENWIARLKLNLELLIKDAGIDNDVQVLDDGTVIVPETKVSLFQRRNNTMNKKVVEQFLDVETLLDTAVLTGEAIDSSVIYKNLTSKKVDEKTAKQVHDKLMTKHNVLKEELVSLDNMAEGDRIVMLDDTETFENYYSDVQNNLDQVIDAANQIGAYLGNKKALKKSEKKFGGKVKARRVEAQVSNVNFKLQDNEYKLASINPVSVIGSMTLLTFNTQSRKLSIYVAKTEEGLSIKGTTLQNFDEVTSFQKLIKKPGMLKMFQEGNVRRVEVLLKDIRAKEATVNGRLNEHTILLKTYKEKFGVK